ncbi:MAG: MFS transporter [archaeon]|nr:MFS transporter [archaeon]
MEELSDNENSRKSYTPKENFGFALFNVGVGVTGGIFLVRGLYFYEVVLKFNPALLALAVFLYTCWDAINDPIMGFLSDRTPAFITQRWGRRFPWVAFSIIPLFVFFILIFSPPDPNAFEGAEWLTFFWLVGFFCLYDTMGSAINTNYSALMPDKFRTNTDRRKIGGYIIGCGLIGTLIGQVLPPLLIQLWGEFNVSTYFKMAIVCGVLGMVIMVITIKYLSEDKEMINRHIRVLDDESLKSTSLKVFFSQMLTAFKQKNFRVLLFCTLIDFLMKYMLMQNLVYYVEFVLNADTTTYITLIIPYVLGFFTMPFWLSVGKKYGYQKILKIFRFIAVLAFLPMWFTTDIFLISLILLLNGIVHAAYQSQLIPIKGRVYDEAAVINKTKLEGIYSGIITFFTRFSFFIIAFCLWIVHEITGFTPEPDTNQPSTAIIGIKVLCILLPAIFSLLGAIVFWKFYDLTPEKHKKIVNELKELNL